MLCRICSDPRDGVSHSECRKISNTRIRAEGFADHVALLDEVYNVERERLAEHGIFVPETLAGLAGPCKYPVATALRNYIDTRMKWVPDNMSSAQIPPDEVADEAACADLVRKFAAIKAAQAVREKLKNYANRALMFCGWCGMAPAVPRSALCVGCERHIVEWCK